MNLNAAGESCSYTTPTHSLFVQFGITTFTSTRMTMSEQHHSKNPLPDVLDEEQPIGLLVPRYHVILLNDDDHTYDYVIEMLSAIFGHDHETAYAMACEVDTKGKVIVDTAHKEKAELRRDQIMSYGADWRIQHCKGSMSAIIEPAE